MMPAVTIDTSENTPNDLPPKINFSRRIAKTDMPCRASEETRRGASNEIPEIPGLLANASSEALRLLLTLSREMAPRRSPHFL
jgi:hypothetical protein